FNPVWGCTKVSPACDNCYAEAWDKRTGGAHWGPHAPRREFGDKHWNEPLKWDRAAAKDGVRRRVFCASMADVFDKDWPAAVRPRLWALIRATPHLDWLLLTKRPQNIAKMLPEDWGAGYPNVWMGTTAENQEELERRWPHLYAVRAAVRFISYEPALGPLDIRFKLIDWIIIGGESGAHARTFPLPWARSVIAQSLEFGVKCFMKQLGSRPVGGMLNPIRLKDKSGADPGEWPADMYIQQFPA